MLVAVAEGRPLAMTIDEGRRPAFGPVRGRPPLAANRTEGLGRATDRPSAGLCRAALYLRGFRPARRLERRARAFRSAISGSRARSSTAVSQASWRPWYDYFPWEDHRASRPRIVGEAIAPGACALERVGRRRGSAADARRDRLRPRRTALERGPRPPALRAALRGGAASRRRAADAAATAERPRSACRWSATTAASWRPGSRACEPRSNTTLSSSS